MEEIQIIARKKKDEIKVEEYTFSEVLQNLLDTLKKREYDTKGHRHNAKVLKGMLKHAISWAKRLETEEK